MNRNEQCWGMDLVLTGATLRKKRRDNHLSQDALVDGLWDMGVEITKNSVSSWETGKKRPSVDHLIALRDFYGCTLDELIVSRQRSRENGDEDQLVPLLRDIFSVGYMHRHMSDFFVCNPLVGRQSEKRVINFSHRSNKTVSFGGERII